MSKLKLNYDSVAVSTATELGKKSSYDAFETAFVCIRDGVTFDKNVTFTSGGIQFVRMQLLLTGELRYYTADHTSILVYKGFMWDNNLEVFEVYKDDKFRYIYDLSNAFTGLYSTMPVDVLKLNNTCIDDTVNDSRFLGDVAKVVTDIDSVVTFETDFTAIKNYVASLPANTTSVIYDAINVDEGGLIYPVGKVTKIEVQKGGSANGRVSWIGPDPEGLQDVITLAYWTTSTSIGLQVKRNVGQFTIASPSVESNLGIILSSNWSKIQETKISYLEVADFKLGQAKSALCVYSSHPDNGPGVLTEDAFGFNNNTYLFNFKLGTYTDTFCSLTTTDTGKVYACTAEGSCVELPNTLDAVRIEEITPGPSLFYSPYFLQTTLVKNGLHGKSDIIASEDELKNIVNDYYARQPRMISMSTPMFRGLTFEESEVKSIDENSAIFELGLLDPGMYAIEIFDEIPNNGMSQLKIPSYSCMITIPTYDNEVAHNMKKRTYVSGSNYIELFNTSIMPYNDGIWAVYISWMPFVSDWEVKSDNIYNEALGIRIRKL